MASNHEYSKVESDVLIIGAGGAGLRAAIEASENKKSVVIVSKSILGKAHTVMAEGGMAASLGNVDKQDSWKVHFADTYIEGVYINNWKMVEIFSKEAADRVYELERFGALFDRTADGKILQRAFGAHTYRRLCHVGDKTGLELIRTLEDKVLHTDTRILDEVVVTKIVTEDGKVKGAIGFSMREGRFYVFQCKALIIATGGLGRLFKVTSNSWESTGDGLAIAFRAGAELRDMEMVQFHPTGMVWPPSVRGLLVTEGVRGEGGILLNKEGERFMLRYSPKKKELDARDVVARCIYREITEGRGTEHGAVYLDITHKGYKFIMDKLPSMYNQFKDFAGVDISKEKMEVAPTVHYHMGGIKVEPETEATNVSGLFAAGEAACGLHGANRLGGNSLTDLLVFGRRAGLGASHYSDSARMGTIDEKEINDEIERIEAFTSKKNPTNPYELIEQLRQAMSSKVGIVRNEKDLNDALAVINQIKGKLDKIGVAGGVRFNPGLIACLELQNMIQNAELLVRAAIERKESRGAHTRSDYPGTNDEFLKNIVFRLENGQIKMNMEPVMKPPKELQEILLEGEKTNA
ncbi:MAG: FAD-binding protein [Candidatus Thermoplasmatota archaeon]|jgi:succinate dehydrogenase / fumarate reductase flavoprotein subunit|nr:FAD-binding protein [Candidatus Thermoplasmatota archaeon]MCL5794383.1 FAD-binding protein [Candidatus Thermoplasmatota archaeon]